MPLAWPDLRNRGRAVAAESGKHEQIGHSSYGRVKTVSEDESADTAGDPAPGGRADHAAELPRNHPK
jgi:hypothetical protein